MTTIRPRRPGTTTDPLRYRVYADWCEERGHDREATQHRDFAEALDFLRAIKPRHYGGGPVLHVGEAFIFEAVRGQRMYQAHVSVTWRTDRTRSVSERLTWHKLICDKVSVLAIMGLMMVDVRQRQ